MPISFLFSNPTSAGYGANNPANNDEMATITEKKIQVFNTEVQVWSLFKFIAIILTIIDY